MNKLRTSLLSILFTAVIGLSANAQTPEGVNYQAVITDNTGDALANASVTMRIGVYSGVSGTVKEYEETHVLSTSDNGHVSLVIGQGSVVSGTFSDVNWGSSNHFVKVEVDKGDGYVNMGLMQMQSVPYALYSKKAQEVEQIPAVSLNDLSDVNTSGASNDAVLKFDGSNWAVGTDNAGNTYTSGTGIDINGTEIAARNDNNIWNAAKIQDRDITTSTPTNGNILKWNGTQWGLANDNANMYSAGTGLSLTGNTFSANTNSALWNANKLQGRDVSTTAPTTGQVLKWDGSNWAPAKDSSGGGSSSSIWSKSGNNIYSGSSDYVGINQTNPTSRLHVWDSVTSGSGLTILGEYRLYPNPSSNSGGWVVRQVGDINSSAEIIGNLAVTTGSSSVTGATNYGFLGLAGAEADNSYGVWALAEESDVRNYGLYSVSQGTGTFNIGGFFVSNRNNSNSNYGVYAIADSGSTATVAGYFDGDLTYTGSLTGPSDQFLKQDIETMPTALDKVMKLEPKTYLFDKSNTNMNLPEGEQFGFLAQDLEQIFPNLVHKQLHIENPHEKEGEVITKEYNSVDYMSLIPVLTKALQEQQELIKELQKEVEDLKSQK